jgi:Ser/Thr protein kinase RdoA (MazF antagonist)
MGEPTPHSADQFIAAAALARYDLPRGTRLRPIRTTNNAVFEVAVDGAGDRPHRYVLRVHRPHYRTVEQIRSELYLLRLLQDELPGDGMRMDLVRFCLALPG